MQLIGSALARATFYTAVLVVTALSVLPVDTVSIFDLWDKLEHALAYAVLGLLGALAYPLAAQTPIVGAALVGWGIVLEIVQLFVPGRFGDPFDVVANTIGVAVGLSVAQGIAMVLAQRTDRTRGNPRTD